MPPVWRQDADGDGVLQGYAAFCPVPAVRGAVAQAKRDCVSWLGFVWLAVMLAIPVLLWMFAVKGRK